MRIMIAYDGSEYADAALRDLGRAGLPDDVEAVVVAVAETWLPPPAVETVLETGEASAADRGVEDASMLAAKACDWLEEMFPHWDVRAVVTRGSPATEVLHRAHEWPPDLLVIGSHGRTAVGRFVLGSVSQRVATEAECSVRVARPLHETHHGLRILVGLDDSEGAFAAVRAIASRRWPEGTEVLVMTVNDPSLYRSKDFEIELNWIEQFQWTAERTLRDAGLQVTRHRAEGDPKRLLPEKAEAWRADCVFVGSHGTGRLKRALLGSVAASVVSRAHCSVEITRELHTS